MRHVAEKAHDIGKFSYLIYPFHYAEVTGVQTCLKRQLLLTSGLDHQLCLWSYTKETPRVSLEIIE